MPVASKKVVKKKVAQTATPAAKQTIQVRTRPSVERRVRAGITFDRQFKALDAAGLSNGQLAALRADPYLEIKG